MLCRIRQPPDGLQHEPRSRSRRPQHPGRLQRHHRDSGARGSDQVRSRQGNRAPSSSTDSSAPSMHYPCNYGYVPKTLADDGDPLDVLVITPFPLQPGVVVRCRPLGVLKMEDEAGGDSKLLAVPIDKILALVQALETVVGPRARAPRADPALLRALQRPREGQVGQGDRLGRAGVRVQGHRRWHRGLRGRVTATRVLGRVADVMQASSRYAGAAGPSVRSIRRYRLRCRRSRVRDSAAPRRRMPDDAARGSTRS